MQKKCYRLADYKSSYLYENLPVQTKMAILSRRLILLAILLYEQFIHYTQINLRPDMQLLSTQQQAYQSFFHDLGREFAQSDSLLTHTFSIVAFLIVMNSSSR